MEGTHITTSELGIKAKSKHEVYRLLWADGNVYIPPEKEANYDYLSSVIRGEKKVNTHIYDHKI